MRHNLLECQLMPKQKTVIMSVITITRNWQSSGYLLSWARRLKIKLSSKSLFLGNSLFLFGSFANSTAPWKLNARTIDSLFSICPETALEDLWPRSDIADSTGDSQEHVGPRVENDHRELLSISHNRNTSRGKRGRTFSRKLSPLRCLKMRKRKSQTQLPEENQKLRKVHKLVW